jgi:hypothetical protein
MVKLDAVTFMVLPTWDKEGTNTTAEEKKVMFLIQ